jgi:hypothetical protein
VRTTTRCGTLRRSLAISITLAVVLAGCRPFGPGLPICGELGTAGAGDAAQLVVTDRSGEIVPLRASHLVQVQAVPTADRGLCIDELPRGWQVEMREPRAGEAALRLADPSLGGRFLDVRLVASCTPAEAARRTSAGTPEVERWVQVHDEGRRIHVTIVPVAERHRRDAWATAVSLIGRQLRGSSLRIEVAGTEKGPVEARIEDALQRGAAVLVIDDGGPVRGDLELRLPDLDRPIIGPLGEVLAELGQRARPPHYAATWWDIAEGSCAVYDIDATGAQVLTLEEDVARAIGSFPLDAVRRELADLGYDLEGELDGELATR